MCTMMQRKVALLVNFYFKDRCKYVFSFVLSVFIYMFTICKLFSTRTLYVRLPNNDVDIRLI